MMGNVIDFTSIKNKKVVPPSTGNQPMTTGDVVNWVNEDLDKLANSMNMSREDAYNMAKAFFETYPALLSYVAEPNFRKDCPIQL